MPGKEKSDARNEKNICNQVGHKEAPYAAEKVVSQDKKFRGIQGIKGYPEG